MLQWIAYSNAAKSPLLTICELLPAVAWQIPRRQPEMDLDMDLDVVMMMGITMSPVGGQTRSCPSPNLVSDRRVNNTSSSTASRSCQEHSFRDISV